MDIANFYAHVIMRSLRFELMSYLPVENYDITVLEHNIIFSILWSICADQIYHLFRWKHYATGEFKNCTFSTCGNTYQMGQISLLYDQIAHKCDAIWPDLETAE